ncbi:nuclear transport factor 2 family protein [Gephyromycinifex aptenodytis]|uniref:nuclear transport factor 2 family protein n=1 Tax=Gephyromycinifex aptenodytis TaxID=2716227 RepID=UPI001B2FFD32|nr:hypothetical protein [Gephyromycinifex aptenodytis]
MQLAELLECERLLHAPEGTRADFERGVAPGYWEVGASGGRYDVDVIWGVVQRRRRGELPTPQWATAQEECRPIGDGYWLLTYLLDQGSRLTRRVTLWQRTAAGWVASYHQGTVVTGQF